MILLPLVRNPNINCLKTMKNLVLESAGSRSSMITTLINHSLLVLRIECEIEIIIIKKHAYKLFKELNIFLYITLYMHIFFT